MKLTAVFRKVPEGYVGFVEELPGANTQGETLEETRRNLLEAISMVMEANRSSFRGNSARPRGNKRSFRFGDVMKRLDFIAHLVKTGRSVGEIRHTRYRFKTGDYC